MCLPWKFWSRQSRSARPGRDWLEHVVVGDPDPTGPGAGDQNLTCQFKWICEVSPTLVLAWCCTREFGHQGQHLAGTGESIVAVHPQALPTATAGSFSGDHAVTSSIPPGRS